MISVGSQSIHSYIVLGYISNPAVLSHRHDESENELHYYLLPQDTGHALFIRLMPLLFRCNGSIK